MDSIRPRSRRSSPTRSERSRTSCTTWCRASGSATAHTPSPTRCAKASSNSPPLRQPCVTHPPTRWLRHASSRKGALLLLEERELGDRDLIHALQRRVLLGDEDLDRVQRSPRGAVTVLDGVGLRVGAVLDVDVGRLA